MVDIDNETGTQTSLADDIGKQLDKAGVTTENEGRQYNRDEGGRFAPKQEEAAPVANGQTALPKTWKPLWYKDEYGEWEKFGEPFRKAVEQRERESAKAIEDRTNQVKAWEPVNQLLAPYREQLAAAGISQHEYVSRLVNADAYLRRSPLEAMDWLAQNYTGMNIMQLADEIYARGQQQPQNGQQQPQAQPWRQEIDQLRNQLSTYMRSGEQQQRAAMETQIQDWAKDKPHFTDVRELMASLANAPVNRGATLDQLYEMALHAHPQLRQRILEDQRKAEVAKAREAGAMSPRGGAANANAQSPKMTLREELAARLDGLM